MKKCFSYLKMMRYSNRLTRKFHTVILFILSYMNKVHLRTRYKEATESSNNTLNVNKYYHVEWIRLQMLEKTLHDSVAIKWCPLAENGCIMKFIDSVNSFSQKVSVPQLSRPAASVCRRAAV